METKTSQRHETGRTPVLVLSLMLAMLAAAWYWGGPVGRPPAPMTDPAKALNPRPPVQGLGDDGDARLLLTSLDESIAVLEKSPDSELIFGPDRVRASDVVAQLHQVRGLVEAGKTGAELVAELQRRYRLYCSAAGPGGILFTGYYQSSLRGSRTRHNAYQIPVYSLPPNLVKIDLGAFKPELAGQKVTGMVEDGKVVPAPDRAAIARGALDGKGLELLYVDDAFEAFSVEVQGSGQVQLDDGTTVQMGYAGENGRPYQPVGRLLIHEGKVPRAKMSMQAIRAYVTAHPDELRHVLDYNPSFVFFKLGGRGPEGSTGAVVTEGRSIATDRHLFPPGALALIQTTRPVVDEEGQRTGSRPYMRLMLNQDTGGAIVGPGDCDIYTGIGHEAEQFAGQEKDHGTLYFFSPLPPLPGS